MQACAPWLLQYCKQTRHSTDRKITQQLAIILALIPAGMALGLYLSLGTNWIIINGLALYGIIFALNSAVHSYLIIEWSDHQKISMNVGFYYMANAGGRLTGTILSGLVYQYYDLIGCLIISSFFVVFTVILSRHLPASNSISP
jgi:predicted MFS family arabinose efflux permease